MMADIHTFLRANDNLPSDIREALHYLVSEGGLAETSTVADAVYHDGRKTLQCEASMMLALCILAKEALDGRLAGS